MEQGYGHMGQELGHMEEQCGNLEEINCSEGKTP